MVMKHKFTFELAKLHLLAVQISRNMWFPVFVDLRELLGEVDFVHSPILDNAQD
jgi:hypothetical protein